MLQTPPRLLDLVQLGFQKILELLCGYLTWTPCSLLAIAIIPAMLPELRSDSRLWVRCCAIFSVCSVAVADPRRSSLITILVAVVHAHNVLPAQSLTTSTWCLRPMTSFLLGYLRIRDRALVQLNRPRVQFPLRETLRKLACALIGLSSTADAVGRSG